MEPPSLDHLVMMPEVLARKALNGRPVRFHVLAPIGPVAGRGSLRVLRARPLEAYVELICGYEAYVPLFASGRGARA